MKADLRHLNDVLQLARLLLYFGSEEEGSCCYRVPVESRERMKHVEPVHVHYCRIYT